MQLEEDEDELGNTFWEAQDLSNYKNDTTGAGQTYSLWWSIVVFVAEIGGFVLTHIGQQMFWKQDTHFRVMSTFTKEQLQKVHRSPLL